MAKNDTVVDEKTLEDKIAEGIAKAMEKALPAMAQAAVQVQISAQDARSQSIAASRLTGERCADCKQFLPPGVTQGKHPHKRMVVFPRSRRNGKWFQGIFINGVRYLSNHASHHITVPEDLDETLLANWEENEEVMKEGREATHDSGDISNPRRADHTAGFR